MTDRPADDDRLFSTRWVHVHEEDTAAGQVYRPDTTAIPLSRRPREHLELRPDGSASLSTGGPDDRPVAGNASWSEDAGAIVVEARTGRRLRIVEHSPTRLLVRS